jgi:hypothetical protein
MQTNKKGYIFVCLQLLLFIAFVFKVDGSLKLFHSMKTFGTLMFLLGGILVLISLFQHQKQMAHLFKQACINTSGILFIQVS